MLAEVTGFPEIFKFVGLFQASLFH